MFSKRKEFLELRLKSGEVCKIYYNPKKLDPDGPDQGNTRLVYGTKREVKNFQKQLNKAGKTNFKIQ